MLVQLLLSRPAWFIPMILARWIYHCSRIICGPCHNSTSPGDCSQLNTSIQRFLSVDTWTTIHLLLLHQTSEWGTGLTSSSHSQHRNPWNECHVLHHHSFHKSLTFYNLRGFSTAQGRTTEPLCTKFTFQYMHLYYNKLKWHPGADVISELCAFRIQSRKKQWTPPCSSFVSHMLTVMSDLYVSRQQCDVYSHLTDLTSEHFYMSM